MIKWILQKIVGNKNQREIRRIRPLVTRINEIEEALQREPEEKIRQLTQKWRDHLARYHDLQAPPKPQLYRMDAEQLRTAARDLEARFSRLREEFPELPASIEATADAIEAAKEAFREIEPSFRERRAKYLEQILPDAYAVVKNGARADHKSPCATTPSLGKWSTSMSSSSAASPCIAA
jgi:preprotein translocase subunit SecA